MRIHVKVERNGDVLFQHIFDAKERGDFAEGVQYALSKVTQDRPDIDLLAPGVMFKVDKADA